MLIRNLVNELIIQSKKAALHQLVWLIDQAGAAPFAEDLLEVDEPLWGGFWQGDVIAPGYRLPAVELALLRATRLDGTWPEGTTVTGFLASLRQAISDPQAGVWTLAVAGEPCLVFASVSSQQSAVSSQKSEARNQRSIVGGQRAMGGGRRAATVVWYCATTERLHAGYRMAVSSLNFSGAVEQRRPGKTGATHFPSASHLELVQSGWLEQLLVREETLGGRQPAACPTTEGSGEWAGGQSLAARLDTEILQLRAGQGTG